MAPEVLKNGLLLGHRRNADASCLEQYQCQPSILDMQSCPKIARRLVDTYVCQKASARDQALHRGGAGATSGA
jgi:hypothetical protein